MQKKEKWAEHPGTDIPAHPLFLIKEKEKRERWREEPLRRRCSDP
jgi:hypothetical protein